jgi:hypothetical protein
MYVIHLADSEKGFAFLTNVANALSKVRANYTIQKAKDISYLENHKNERIGEESSVNEIINFLLSH